jgi:hypothetical protein
VAKIKDAYRILVEKAKRSDHLGDQIKENDIKMCVKESVLECGLDSSG